MWAFHKSVRCTTRNNDVVSTPYLPYTVCVCVCVHILHMIIFKCSYCSTQNNNMCYTAVLEETRRPGPWTFVHHARVYYAYNRFSPDESRHSWGLWPCLIDFYKLRWFTESVSGRKIRVDENLSRLVKSNVKLPTKFNWLLCFFIRIKCTSMGHGSTYTPTCQENYTIEPVRLMRNSVECSKCKNDPLPEW